MAHPMNVLLDRLDGKKPTKCNDKCKNWKHAHLETACILSDVYSVKKGEPCFIYDEVNK